jgi:hypothetical protein
MIDYLANQTMNRNPRPEIGGFLFAPIIHLLFLFSFIEITFFKKHVFSRSFPENNRIIGAKLLKCLKINIL